MESQNLIAKTTDDTPAIILGKELPTTIPSFKEE